MNGIPSRSIPRSITSTTFGCATRAVIRASVRKEWRNDSLRARSRLMTFTATFRPTSRFSASYTVPWVPDPSTRPTAYFPPMTRGAGRAEAMTPC